MNATMILIVTCKCPGKAGALRFEVPALHGPDAYSYWRARDDALPGEYLRADLIQRAIWGSVRCWGCRKFFKVAEVCGNVTEHKCNSKCEASKGPVCDCSCGGENHGKSWSYA